MAAAMAAPPLHDHDVAMEAPKYSSNEQNIHTPPASDMSSHGRKGDEDDAASSSELSDLDDQFEGEPQPSFAQDVPIQDASAAVEPDRYEGGIPIFQPTMDQFQDFEKYMNAVNPYGMKSGIVLIDPPEEWKAARKALDDMVKVIKVRNPITQEFHHNEYGIYTQRNMEKMRTYNLPQWKALCEQSQYQPPARRGERRIKAGTQAGSKVVPLKRKSEPLPLPEGVKRRAGRPRVKPLKEEKPDEESSLLAPPTPTSPANDPPVPAKNEDTEMADHTPTKRRGRPFKGGGQAKSRRQPKATTNKAVEKCAGEKATTVAARRLHNEADAAADDVNEEDFKDFDYRTHNHHEWTKERCEELEEKYWKSLSYTNPMYGADMPGSLFDDDTKCWNVAKLPNLLDILGSKIPGVNTAYLYLGMWRATFAWHLEDVDLYSINYIHFGAPKQWYSISQADAPKFEKAMRSIYANEAKNCDQFLRHKTFLVSPSLLKNKYGVTVNRVVHREGQFVVTFPIGYHSGYNLGYNCAESVNFALESWLPYGKTSKKCQCEDDSVFIDVDWFIRRLNGEPTPEIEEWVEVTDDEDDLDGPTDLPTPPGSERGHTRPAKRKRPSTKDGGGKKMKRIKIKISKSAVPCCLCPNNFDCDELLPTDDNRKAHRRCALYTPETYFDEVDGREYIRGLPQISKARLELRCNECRQKRGSCFQCSSAKCTRAYHATCAAQAGVQVDIGDIAIYHEGVEYRDTGLDFRCKMHRSVKAAKPSSDLARDNYRHIEKDTREFHAYLTGLKQNDIVQYQASSADDIEAGVLVEPLDEEEGILVIDLLPNHQRRFIEANTVLFVNASTSCLQKPSPNAKEFPKHLRGLVSREDPTNRKPSRLDLFCEGQEPSKPYLWEEFTSTVPAFNEDQKAVDISKDRRLWHYLGNSSTESKAHYTGDLTKFVNDPASNFLQSVEPAKRPLIPQPQPMRRQSLPASYPGQHPVGANSTPGNVSMAAPRRLSHAEQVGQQKIEDYQRRMATLGSPAASMTPAQYYKNYPASGNRSPVFPYQDQRTNCPPSRDNMLATQRLILERSQQRATALDQQDRPYLYKPKCSMPPPNIGIDTQSVERQREFQRRAYQQSLANTQISPHSPGQQPGFLNGQISPGQRGIEHVATQVPPNTAIYGRASPSPTEAAFPLLRRPLEPSSSSHPDYQQDSFQLHNLPISPQQPAAGVNFSHDQRSLSQPTYPQPQHFPQPPSAPLSPPPNFAKMSAHGRSAPIDIPASRQSAAARSRNQGQHTANFIDPNLVQLNPNHSSMTAAAHVRFPHHKDKETSDPATRSMPPPPVPSHFLHPALTTTATNFAAHHGEAYRKYGPYEFQQQQQQQQRQAKRISGPDVNSDLDPTLTAALKTALATELTANTETGEEGTRVNDKEVPKSVADLRHSQKTLQSRPNVYPSPFLRGGRAGARGGYRVTAVGTGSGAGAGTGTAAGTTPSEGEGEVSYGNGLSSTLVSEGGDEVDGGGFVVIEEGLGDGDGDGDEVEYAVIEHEDAGGVRVGSGSGSGSGSGAGIGIGGPGLADSYYMSRSEEQKRLIDVERERMGRKY